MLSRIAAVRLSIAALLAAAVSSATGAGTVGFEEDFALAPDRAAAIKQLIPGTEEYYYYTALNLQNQGRLDDVDKTITAWINQHGDSGRVPELQNRQALLRYATDPLKSLAYLKDKLNLQFDHQRETQERDAALPTELDPALLTLSAWKDRAFSRNPETLEGVENSALEELAANPKELSNRRLHELLSRLARPDVPGLVALVVRDLKSEFGSGFGSLSIHRAMLLDQLDDLLKQVPSLLNDSNFVTTYMLKLHPAVGVDWQHDPKEEEAYLDRLQAFTDRLGPANNSLKAHVLYQRLVFERKRGNWDKERFMAYIKLPRPVFYINPKYIQPSAMRDHQVDLNANYGEYTRLPIIGNDEPLVRSYLLHLLTDANDTSEYSTFIKSEYLKQTFAEAKLTAGVGSAEKWYALLGPAQVQALKDRVDIDFSYTNKDVFLPDDVVKMDVEVKNVKKLIVKVYEINATNYYKLNKREVTADINLDGLVANDEQTIEYADAPMLRVHRSFEFKSLSTRGVYVVEFIGNGKSSRALIRKGKLRYVEEPGAAGHVFTVMDESNNVVKDAHLWMANRDYPADADGTITVPYSTSPGTTPLVLSSGDFSSIDYFTHKGENYRFTAGIHVSRESLIKYGTATVAIHPALFLNDAQISPDFLKDIVLTITSVDADGVATSKDIPNFTLYENRESTYEFAVPDRLRRISFTLRAKIENISNGRKDDLTFSKTFDVNAIDGTTKIQDLHFTHIDGVYYIDVIGKDGESRPNVPVNLAIKHEDFRQPMNTTLKSDAAGRIKLGTLQGIATITATGPEGTHLWSPISDGRTYNGALHGAEGETLQIPFMGKAKDATRADFSLLELRDSGTYVADRFDALTVKDGFLEIKRLPAGDYSLLLKDEKVPMTLRIAKGTVQKDWLLSNSRYLQLINRNPLQIVSTTTAADKITIRLANTNALTRVHVYATRFVPTFDPETDLDAGTTPRVSVRGLATQESYYQSGIIVGDEYRYIIDRKYATKYPGVMLDRPGILLNPWAIRPTETAVQIGGIGGSANGGSLPMNTPSQGFGGFARSHGMAPGEISENVDFLPEPTTAMLNLTPDKDGVITIDRTKLGEHNEVHIVAIDPYSTVYREISLPQPALHVRDFRQATSLEPAKHFVEQKQITLLEKGATLVIGDAGANMELYDSLAKIYRLYATLRPSDTLNEFSFILTWPTLAPDKKRELYSKYACHELNFFLSRRDPAFFETVVLPYLKNKRDKTFMDHYLIGDDLASYSTAWQYGRLNTVERILLAQHLAGEAPRAARAIKDRFDLLPPNIEAFNALFSTAIKGSALESSTPTATLRPAPATPTMKPGAPSAAAEAPIEAGKPGGDYEMATETKSLHDSVDKLDDQKGKTTEDLDDMAKNEEQLQKYADDKLAAKKSNGGGGGGRGGADAAFDNNAKQAQQRLAQRRFYRKLDKTMELAENNYYHLPIQAQLANLIDVNGLWKDYAAFIAADAKDKPFLSRDLAEPTGNFSEMMFAMSVIDLPFDAPKHDTKRDGGTYTLTAAGPAIAYHKEIKEAAPAAEKTPILVSQNYYRASDRYTYVDNERTDKYIAGEFLTQVVYGCQVVVTNPTSSRQKLDALMQLPKGAMPVANAQYTRGLHVELQPYETRAVEYQFYFPAPGEFPHYPVQVAKNEKFVAAAEATTLKVVVTPSKVDTTSWDYISQNGTADEVIKFLADNNIERLNLEKIAWRMADALFYKRALALLADRHIYNNTLWSYAIKNNDAPNIREFLQHQDGWLAQCGPYIDSPLVAINPIARQTYEHLEYAPLINARAHRLGKNRMIVNDRFYQQYEKALQVLRYHPTLTDDDKLAVTYYMLLQDRVDEAMNFFKQIEPKNIAEKVQYDYFTAYLAFYSENPSSVRQLVDSYKNYPVDRWQKLFANVASQLDELQGKGPKIVNTDDRNQQQNQLAATEPTFDFNVDAKQVVLNYKNVDAVRVNYYLMDLELLFSENPFLHTGGSGQFSMIKPNATAEIKLDPAKSTQVFALPDNLLTSNVMVEVVGANETKSQAYYANSLTVATADNYGTLTVSSQSTGKALPKAYVKVYARMKDGQIKFYKDGYTDLRGRFDYTSLSTNDLDNVANFSLLVATETDGAIVREVLPPKQ